MCEYCGRDYEGKPVQLPLNKVSGEGILKSYIRKNDMVYEIVFELEDGEYSLEIDKCLMCDMPLALDTIYYVKTKDGYICEDIYNTIGKFKIHENKKYAYPYCFKSMAESVAEKNDGEVVSETMFVDEANTIYDKFDY